MDENIISAQNVHKKFGKVAALNGLNLNVRRGTIFSLLGPNGAGKTTFIRILTTLLRPDEGHIEISGLDVLKNPHQVRLVIGLAGQFAAVDDILTGKENLELVGKLYHLEKSEVKRKAASLLKYFGLEEAANRKSKTYSGGMRRRLDLAASLMGNPQILFLDEPTNGLDPQSRLSLWEIIRNLASRGTTIFLTTQYLEEADNLASEIAVIDKGRIIAEGTPRQLKEKLGGNVIELHLEDKDQMEKTFSLLQNESIGEVQKDPLSARITVKTATGTRALTETVLLLEKEKILLSDIVLRKPTLDEVFLALTGDEASFQSPKEQTEVRQEEVVFEAQKL